MKTARFSLLGIALCMIFTQLVTAQTWTSEGPEPRALHSAVVDSTTNKMIVFGGYASNANTNSVQNFNDVWRLNLNNSAWTQAKPKGTAPAGRVGQSAVYDPGSNRMIVFAGGLGRTSPCTNDVWVLTNANGSGGAANWIQLTPSGSAPGARMQHGAAYDPNTNTMIVFGGQNCAVAAYSDVWVLSNANGVSGTPTWTELSPSGTGPGIREIGQSTAYDPTTNTLMIFGNGGNSGRTNDFWVLSNANGQGGTPVWTQLTPSGTSPTPRGGDSMTYDPTTNVATIVAGSDSSGNLLGDVWVLSNANGSGGTPAWTQLAAGSTYFPEARDLQTAVYNPSTNKLTVFGGNIGADGSLSLFTNDVFVLSHANGQ